MVKQLGERTAVVSSKELGTNCWLAKRFVKDGGRCCRVWTCNYPEKKTCQAVQREIDYLRQEQQRLAQVSSNIDTKIEELAEMLVK